MKFSPCNGNCTDDGDNCKGCGRAHEEIAETRKMVKGLVEFAQKMSYENPEEFTDFIGKNVLWKLNSEQQS